MVIETRTTRRGFTRQLAAALALPVALSAIAGCENELPPGMSRKEVKIADIPDDVMSAARKSLPGINFNEAWKNLDRDGKLHSYEIRGRASNGKIREARVSPTGEILEME